ncbi:TRAP dicarboxylate transporter subunit DctQ [Isoalcanivorax pacificus W11-5]|uniref:TRAP transporter small permease protein n=1 Tax=Isoalcanivorax pacificus W11-5 TaxID=391936 RepID=A0A0B4XRY2_9GAMM|nr:TRAP transporter small permease subunit [Isoalcanivorax pacificus]AJD49223.1 TRAP dicarboxylate transporter subunit DctQ [Isoalcanivorax pacificus W11-5]
MSAQTATPDSNDVTLPDFSGQGFLPWLQRASYRLARAEQVLAGVFVGLVFLLLILNISTRAFGNALYWVDEAAVTAMVWMAFLAASVSLYARANIAVTLLTDALPAVAARALAVLVDLVLLAFVLALIWMLWRWFAPMDLYSVGFDTDALAAEFFNFIYQEPTQTLGVAKFWLWLILPVFGIASLIHALSNLDISLARLLRAKEA